MVTLVMGLLIGNDIYAKNIFDWRMVIYPSMPIANKAKVQEAIDYTARMEKAGYNGMFVDGAQMRRLKTLGATVKADIQRFVSAAGKNGITIIPMSQGQTGNPAFITANRDEAFPCKGTRFQVANGVALAKGDATVALTNAGFENGTSGWKLTGANFKLDNVVKRSGSASLRCDDPTTKYLRATQSVKVKPFTTYELSMWVKTQNIQSYNQKYGDKKCRDIGFTVQSPPGNYIYSDRYFANGLGANSNWKQVKTAFYSMNRTSVLVEVQATRGLFYTGKVWYDDISIKEVGLYETVIRDGMGVTVKTAAGNLLAQGKDYKVGDKKLIIPGGSSVKNGDELLVDWHKEANVAAPHSNPAFCYNDIWNSVRQEIATDDAWFGTPPARLMKYSEWRLAGWDPVCNQRYQVSQVGSGRYMSAVANMTNALYKEANGSRLALVFNDAFDPYHNSKDNYYVIRGGCVGSGYNLDEDIIILNWCGFNRSSSLKFFAGTENINRPGWGIKTSRQKQIISCNPASTKDWVTRVAQLEQEGKLKDGDVIGIAYHTYKTFPEWYQKIEEMASTCRAAGRWGSGTIPFPKATPGIPVTDLGPKIDNNGFGKQVFENISLQAARTPVSRIRSLQFSLAGSGHVRLSLFNLSGQNVARVMAEPMAAGTYERKIDVSRMAPGVYFARLEVATSTRLSTGGRDVQRVTKKMVVF